MSTTKSWRQISVAVGENDAALCYIYIPQAIVTVLFYTAVGLAVSRDFISYRQKRSADFTKLHSWVKGRVKSVE